MSISPEREKELENLCRSFRIDVLKTLHAIQSGHPGGSLSVCEILAAVYLEKANIDPGLPNAPDRDRVLLCKGHAAPMLYRILAEVGFFSKELMPTLRQINSRLQGHPSFSTPGVDMPSGPLGIGLAAAQGIALGLRLSANSASVYAILGDGEINEGTVWETAMSASKFRLGNLIAILDYNGVQLDGTTEGIMPLGNIRSKWEAFGWEVLECDGHNISEICDALDRAKQSTTKPSIIVARTVKGKGVSFMEDKNTWHGKPVSDTDLQIALADLTEGMHG